MLDDTAGVTGPGTPDALRRAAAVEVEARGLVGRERESEQTVARYLRNELPRAVPAAPRQPDEVRAAAMAAAAELRAAGHERPLIVATFPGFHANPFSTLMEQAYASHGLAAVHVASTGEIQAVVEGREAGGYRAVLHVNGPDRFLQDARAATEARGARGGRAGRRAARRVAGGWRAARHDHPQRADAPGSPRRGRAPRGPGDRGSGEPRPPAHRIDAGCARRLARPRRRALRPRPAPQLRRGARPARGPRGGPPQARRCGGRRARGAGGPDRLALRPQGGHRARRGLHGRPRPAAGRAHRPGCSWPARWPPTARR